jgi:glycine oxidase
MSRAADNRFDSIFVGGGVIGLACAWRAAQRGARVCVLERERPAAGASGVAAGMLAPVGEASWGEEEILELNLESLRRWPDFAEALEEESGLETEFAQKGALHVALDRDEAEELRRRYALHRTLGLESEWLTGRSCRELEAGLATAVRGGTHVPGEASVDPRKVVAALLSALEDRRVEVRSGAEVVEADRRDGAWRVRTSDGSALAGTKLVIAAGPWSGRMDWLPEVPPVRPVKGEILTLSGSAERPVCERIVAGERVYVVPRADGRVIVGATVEERGFDATVTAGGVHELLREAYRLLPEIAELELLETSAGLRPGTPDNAPLVGAGAAEDLLIATGHFRNGVLQTPITADAITALIAGEPAPASVTPFSPQRFERRSTDRPVGVG